MVVGTLLGPEGAGLVVIVVVVIVVVVVGVVCSWESCLLVVPPGCVLRAGAGGVRWWVIFRTLRTAQWTRASSKFL